MVPIANSSVLVTGSVVTSSSPAIANPPTTVLPSDEVFIHKVLFKGAIVLPAWYVEQLTDVPVLLKMAPNMFHALLPASMTNEVKVTAVERTDGVLGSSAKLQVATCLVLADVLLSDGVLLGVTSARALRSMHATKVLGEQILAVEVIVVEYGGIVWVSRRLAQVAAPVTKLDVLSADVTFPFVLGSECRCTVIPC